MLDVWVEVVLMVRLLTKAVRACELKEKPYQSWGGIEEGKFDVRKAQPLSQDAKGSSTLGDLIFAFTQ